MLPLGDLPACCYLKIIVVLRVCPKMLTAFNSEFNFSGAYYMLGTVPST